MALKAIQFLALMLTALALVPVGAHLLALPNKIGLPQDQYFIVQGIYRGWAFLGAVLMAAILADLAAVIMLRGRGAAFGLALLALLCLAASLAIFFAWAYPANVATANWTLPTADWEALRGQWEYSHAVNAGVTFVSFCSMALSVLISR